MDIRSLQDKFERMGARVNVGELASRARVASGFTIDVMADRKGEYFDMRARDIRSLDVVATDIRPEMRHLLLMVRGEGKFLCGHDERHWFVAAVPGNASSVRSAMEALKPALVLQEQARKHLRQKDALRRRNAAFIRQGEWFFVPVPDLKVIELLVMKNEPLSRGSGSKPHMCEDLYRVGGETVYVCANRPNGLAEAQYVRLIATNPKARSWRWRVMRRDPQAYARGRVWHPDHKTIYLHGWHRVLMNRENEAPAMRNVVFLD